MDQEQKQKLFEEQLFKKNWAKFLKLSPIVSRLSSKVGKSSRCNVNGPKKEVAVQVQTSKKKKK